MSLHPKIIDLTLDRVWRLLDALGNPERRLPPVIHIAGTNGKGSTQAMIRAGLEAAGRTVPRLYLAAPGALPRAHPARRRADLRARADRRCWTSARRPTAARRSPTSRSPPAPPSSPSRGRRPTGRCWRWGWAGGSTRPTWSTPRADGDHAGLARPPAVSGRHARGRSRARRRASSSAACPASSARRRTTALEVIEAAAARLGAPLLAQASTGTPGRSAGGWSFRTRPGCWTCRCRACPGRTRSTMPAPRSRRCGALGCGRGRLRGRRDAGRLARADAAPDARAAGRGGAGRRELWLDGGHNPAAGAALAATLDAMPRGRTAPGLRDAEHQGRGGLHARRWPARAASAARGRRSPRATRPCRAEATAAAATAAGIGATTARRPACGGRAPSSPPIRPRGS